MSTAEPDMKLKKSEVNYSFGHKGSNCGVCKWFTKGTKNSGICRWVKGEIHPDDWCELFHRDHG